MGLEAEGESMRAKVETVTAGMRNLSETWHARADLYEQNLEYNKLLREIKLLDAWLTAQDALAHTDVLGDSVSSVEALIKQHSDFENTLRAMQQRFELLSRESRLEIAMRELREREALSKQKADAQFELERKREAERKKRLEQRRMDERRRTQEIVALVANHQQPQIPSSVVIPIDTSEPVSESLSQTMSSHSIAAANEAMSQAHQQTSQTSTNTSAVRNKKDRNRTRSIRDRYKLPLTLPQPSVRGQLARKQEFQKGGQRAPIREYQTFYTTVHANLMCFFVDVRDYNQLNAACQPVNLYNCKLARLEDTTVQRYVIHLETADGAEYLFDAAGDQEDEEALEMWFARMQEASGM